MPNPYDAGLLAAYLESQRESILRDWRARVRKDHSLKTNRVLPRSQLNDHVPALLDGFVNQLRTTAPANLQSDADAAAHGLHRWQQGYDLFEVTRELGLLNSCMVGAFDDFAAKPPGAPIELMRYVRLERASVSARAIEESTSQYFELQRLEAAGHVNDLETALAQLREMEGQRAELWRQIAHDLRGNVGVVATAARGLDLSKDAAASRDRFISILGRNVTTLRHLLDDVTSLTRLQAGHEARDLATMDVATEIGGLCEGLQAFATERHLYLRCDGAEPFLVTGDIVKLRRLAQNLILNALKYTEQGGVTVRWQSQAGSEDPRWVLSIEDTGPGMHAGTGSPLAGAISNATQLAHEADGAVAAPVTEETRPVRENSGEGIGLSIVKRLADLLDASVEMESVAAQGTTFNVLFPMRYDDL